MKTLYGTIAALFLLASVAVALPNEQPNSVAHGNFDTSYSTPIASANMVKYVIVETTGSVTAATLTIRDNTTSKLTVSVAASTAGTTTVDLSECPVLLKTNLNIVADVADGGITYTVIYQKVDY